MKIQEEGDIKLENNVIAYIILLKLLVKKDDRNCEFLLILCLSPPPTISFFLIKIFQDYGLGCHFPAFGYDKILLPPFPGHEEKMIVGIGEFSTVFIFMPVPRKMSQLTVIFK